MTPPHPPPHSVYHFSGFRSHDPPDEEEDEEADDDDDDDGVYLQSLTAVSPEVHLPVEDFVHEQLWEGMPVPGHPESAQQVVPGKLEGEQSICVAAGVAPFAKTEQ